MSTVLFYLTHRLNHVRCYHFGPEWTWKWWLWKGTPHSLKLQHYWNLTIRLFSVISWTLVGGVLSLCWEAVSVFWSPSRLALIWRGSYPFAEKQSVYSTAPTNWAIRYNSLFILTRHAGFTKEDLLKTPEVRLFAIYIHWIWKKKIGKRIK